MKCLSSIILAICFSNICGAQSVEENTPRRRSNTVYLELGGPFGDHSYNYERQFPLDNQLSLAVSAGVSPGSLRVLGDYLWGANLAVKGIYKNGKNHWSFGGGANRMVYELKYREATQTYPEVYFFCQAGYTRVTRSGFMFGAYHSPVYLPRDKDLIWYWPALHVGYAF